MYCAELNSADAVPRSRVGNQQLTMRELAGNAGDSTRPSMKRMENNATAADTPARPSQPTVPCSRVNSDQRIRLMPYTRRAPKRSSNQPPGTWPRA
ncbi:hypothetical protein D3C73_1486340 [compost metagenome]